MSISGISKGPMALTKGLVVTRNLKNEISLVSPQENKILRIGIIRSGSCSEYFSTIICCLIINLNDTVNA